jgi:hypothetical protein
VICNEIEHGASQKDIAMSYAMAMRSAAAGADAPEWGTINRAFIAKWNIKALSRIKDRAWGPARKETSNG